MPSACTNNVRRNEEPRSLYQARIERIAQIDCRPFRIDATEIAQGRETVVHVLLGDTKPLERFGRGGLEGLRRQIPGIHREMDMGVDETRGHRSIGEVDNLGAGRPTDWSMRESGCLR